MNEKLTDKELYARARQYGQNALRWRRKFIGLLPEVERRRLWEKRGFGSIFEFAQKLAGLSEAQVRRALNLDRRFEDKPALHNLLTSGEVSMNKLARVVSIANPENEEELAEAVKVLPQKAVETLVRDEKIENGLFKPNNGPESVRVHTFEVRGEAAKKLQELQDKGLDINEILLQLLQQREEDIQEEKAAIAQELPTTTSRYIPARVRRILRKEHGATCSIPHCTKPAEHLHHSQPFALSQRHDPRYLAPLCRAHHDIAHSINLRVREERMRHAT